MLFVLFCLPLQTAVIPFSSCSSFVCVCVCWRTSSIPSNHWCKRPVCVRYFSDSFPAVSNSHDFCGVLTIPKPSPTSTLDRLPTFWQCPPGVYTNAYFDFKQSTSNVIFIFYFFKRKQRPLFLCVFSLFIWVGGWREIAAWVLTKLEKNKKDGWWRVIHYQARLLDVICQSKSRQRSSSLFFLCYLFLAWPRRRSCLEKDRSKGTLWPFLLLRH